MIKRNLSAFIILSLVVSLIVPIPRANAQLNNPNTDWMSGNYGVAFHYLQNWINETKDGGSKEWNDAVNAFDVNGFANEVSETGAKWVIFTVGQNSGYYVAPNATLDSYSGYKPGERNSERDLIMDMADALKAKDIKLILYLPSNAPKEDTNIAHGFGLKQVDANGNWHADEAFVQKWAEVIKEWSDRYGTKIAGWWFDGFYGQNGYTAPWGKYYSDAAKSGNPNSVISLNLGASSFKKASDYQDYLAGERGTDTLLSTSNEGRWIEGVQWHALTPFGGWSGDSITRKDQEAIDYTNRVIRNGGAISWNIGITWDGHITKNHFAMFKRIKDSLTKRNADKSSLGKLMTEAKLAYDAAVTGSEPGQYPAGAKEQLKAVIDAAKLIMEDNSLFQYEVNEAYDELAKAFQVFKDSVNKDPKILEIAAGIKSIEAPASSDKKLKLPAVPDGYSIAIKSTDKPNVVRMDGTIVPQAALSTVTLILEVTRTSDGVKADTGSIQVVIPPTSTTSIPLVTVTDGPTTIYGSSVVQLQTLNSKPKWSVTKPDGTATTDAVINAAGFLYATKEGTYKVSAGNDESTLITFTNMTPMPNLTVNNNGKGSAFGSTKGSYPPENVFDGNPATFYEHNSTNAYVGWDFGKPVAINVVRYLPRTGTNAQRSQGAILQGSNVSPSSGFEDLYYISEYPQNGTDKSWYTINLNNEKEYRYYRWLGAVIDGNNTRANVAELQFYVNIDRTALTNEINKAKSLLEGEFTTSSWKAIQSALTNAMNVNGNEQAAQSQIDLAKAALQKAVADLQQITIQSMKDTVDGYIHSGDLIDPLKNQLKDRLDQAEYQLNKGSYEQATKKMEDFLKHLNNAPMQRYISDEAKAVLKEDAQKLIAKWSSK
ncbi:FIMAH domain-containing protein [Neobacillus sp. NPDC058068]|uniref:FIMAH domain-containing protein n=1 Tax=Neobacillus sp. NPDC058068 TaxID=3346325 RepID=UPI0036DCB606